MPSPLDTTVKFIASWMPGAPQISNATVGNYIAALDIMVNGMDSRSGSISVTSGLATLTFAGGAHAATQHAVILVSASGDVSLDGEQKVLTSDATTITFPTNAANGTYTCTFMLAPMGWEKPFTGTNKAVYRSLDVTNERMYLRVSHATVSYADVRMYRTMSDVDTGTDMIPDVVTQANWRWGVRVPGHVGNPPYMFVTDGKRLYAFVESFYHSVNLWGGGTCNYFGPIISRTEIVDPNNTILSGTVNTASNSHGIFNVGVSGSLEYISKEYTGVGAFKRIYFALAATGVTSWSGGNTTTWGTNYPDPVTGGLITSDVYVLGAGTNAASGGVRGKMPGIQIACQGILGIFNTGDFLEINGKTHVALRTASNSSTAFTSTVASFIDIEGPWV